MAERRDWLVDIRKGRGLTGIEIAEKLGIAKSTWYGYEQGYRTPRGKEALQIANLLEFPVEYFFCDDGRELNKRKEVI